MSTHNVCGCTSEDCRVNGCLMKRQRNEAGGFYAAGSADCGCSTRSGGRMTTKHTGGPAFPVRLENGGDTAVSGFMGDAVNPGTFVVYGGLTIRDYFAAKVCAALLTSTSADADYPNLDYRKNSEGQTLAERIAGISYQMADAMLAAREEA